MSKTETWVRVRIEVSSPPIGVAFALQEGADRAVPPTKIDGDTLIFEFTLKVADLGSVPVRFTGPFAQGPASGRFVYICSGSRAGQIGSCWDRRAKVPLCGVAAALVAKAISEGRVLEAQIHGRAKDGGPACASVKLLRHWEVK